MYQKMYHRKCTRKGTTENVPKFWSENFGRKIGRKILVGKLTGNFGRKFWSENWSEILVESGKFGSRKLKMYQFWSFRILIIQNLDHSAYYHRARLWRARFWGFFASVAGPPEIFGPGAKRRRGGDRLRVGTARAEDAQGTHTQSHISPSILGLGFRV